MSVIWTTRKRSSSSWAGRSNRRVWPRGTDPVKSRSQGETRQAIDRSHRMRGRRVVLLFCEENFVSKKLAWWLLPMMMLVSGTAAAEVKVAVLNLERAIGDSDEAKAAMEKIQKEIEPERVQIKTLNDDITALQDRLQKDREVIS